MSDAKKKFLGFITYGSKKKHNGIPVAKQALVFMVTAVNGDFSFPVAHFFIDSLVGMEKAYLIKEVLRSLTNVGIKVINLTFDGFPNNFTACTRLGASFKLTDLRPYFTNPFDSTKIHITLDACHMLKLVRNCLADEKVLHDGDNQSIEWKFIDHLEKYRVHRNFVPHNLTKKHIQWSRKKMSVRLVMLTSVNSDSTNQIILN